MVECRPADITYLPNPHRIDRASSLPEAISLVSASACPHRLRPVERNVRPVTCVSSALDLGDCALVYVQYGFDVAIDAGCIEDYFLVKSTLAGTGYLRSGDQSVVTSPRSIVITCPTERTQIGMSAQCRHLTVRISRQALETSLAEKLGRRVAAPLRFALEISTESHFGCGWRELLSHICQLSSTAPGVLAPAEMRKQYARTMIEMLLTLAPHNHSEALSASLAPALPWHVRRAREYIRAYLPEVRSVAELASSVGTTARTLQSGFRQVYGRSPAEYIRLARVAALHQALLTADSGQNVTRLMESLGIVNFSRYARYYRQQFGELPSTTLRRGAGSDPATGPREN